MLAARGVKRVLLVVWRLLDLRAFWMFPTCSCRTTQRAKEPAILIPGVWTRRTLLPRLVCTPLQPRLHVHCEIPYLVPYKLINLKYQPTPPPLPTVSKKDPLSETDSYRCDNIPNTFTRNNDKYWWSKTSDNVNNVIKMYSLCQILFWSSNDIQIK